MEGTYFYWFSWCLWIIYTFLAQKHPFRLFVCACVLLFITFSIHYVLIGPFRFSIAYIMLLLISYYFAMKKRRWQFIYFALSSAVVTMTYASFYLFRLFDPVWIFLDETWMLAIALLIPVFLLYRSFFDRALLLTVGCCQGDFFYAIVVHSFSFSHPVGSLPFFDGWSLSSSVLFVWRFIDYMPIYIDYIFDRKTKEVKT